MATRILLLTGMTPDARIFAQLAPQLPTACVVPWIAPRPHESIPDYARRLARSISSGEDVIVCGVSFGGIIARELALRLNAKACVLISSVRDASQLPPWFRVLRPLASLPVEPILKFIGAAAASYPRRIRSSATARLRKLTGVDGAWQRWATAAVLRWRASRELDSVPLIQIHGDCDAMFPLRFVQADIVIAGGGHMLALTHAEAIAEVLADAAKRTRSDRG